MFVSRLSRRLKASSASVRRQSTVAAGAGSTRRLAVPLASFVAGGATLYLANGQADQKKPKTPPLGTVSGPTTTATPSSTTSTSTSTTTTPPNLNPASGYPFPYLSPPSPAQVTARLNETTWSVDTPAVSGVSSYHGSQLPSNGPCEDAFVHGTLPSPLDPSAKPWMLWGVFDGHLGSQTSLALSQYLPSYVHHHLTSLAPSSEPASLSSAIHAAIKKAFLALDSTFIDHAQDIVADPTLTFSQKVTRLTTGTNGSCALLSLYDPATRSLHVACTGDSRAVLGIQSADPTSPEAKYDTIPLSVDQSGSSATEEARIRALHPDEPDVVARNRVLGLACSRSFGDGYWKWPLEFQADVRARFLTNTLRPHTAERYKTPPYITAEPEVTTTELKLKQGQRAFMIMASDGLWDTMSSEQAVELVGRWVDARAKGKWTQALKADKGEAAAAPEVKDWKDYYSTGYKVTKESYTVQDGNAAVHLTRNALGGKNQDLVSALLSFKPPYSRYARDDITVQVVFFE